MKKVNYLLILLLSALLNVAVAQKSILQSGPMVGYSDFREVLIWVQTKEEASVKIAYWTEGGNKAFTDEIRTNREDYYIAKLHPHEVDYGTSYKYEVYINDVLVSLNYPLEFQTQTLWQYRTSPPEVNFAVGSCNYVNDKRDNRPGKNYGAEFGIFEEIRKKDPDFMMWLGDNTYLRVPDFLSERGINYRYTKDRSLPEMQALLGSVHHYAIWDDHDYGPNNSDWTYFNKKKTEKAFNLFWGNPNTNLTGKGGITGSFMWADVQFFLLDNRYFRTPNESTRNDKEILGEAQIDWLIDALISSTAPFKFVCIGGQTISSAAVHENYATFPVEREKLLNRIEQEKIEGVVFFSGDRHHAEISKLDRPSSYPLIDFTTSPLTSGTHKKRDEGNTNQVEGTDFFDRNFGMINVSGKFRDRKMVYTLYNNKGEKIYDYEIHENDLKIPE